MIRRLITGFKLLFLPAAFLMTGMKDYARGVTISLPGRRSIHLFILPRL